MKKMIMLAAIAMGIAVHAASVSWTASNIAPSEANTDVTSYMAYIIDNSAYAQSDVTKDTLAAAVGAAAYSSAIVATSTTATTGKLPSGVKFTDGYAAGDKPSYYMVVIDGSSAADATGFMITTPKSATVTAAGALTMGFGSMASAAAGGWQEGPGATPEPTSGLLLLLGGAMLALRRKQK